MIRTGKVLFLTGIFTITTFVAGVPSFAADEAQQGNQKATKTLTTTLSNPQDSDLPDIDTEKCEIKSDNEDCIKLTGKSTNTITYDVYTGGNLGDTCKKAKLTVSCQGYKKNEITYFGINSSSLLSQDITLTPSSNILQKAGDGLKQGVNAVGDVAKKGANAVAKGATSAWNSTKDFVGGIFKGAEPCSKDADKTLKDADTNIEKTKLNTKQDGTDGKDGAKGKCIVAKCKKGWVPNDDKNGCIQSEGDCTETAKQTDANATAGELKKGKCHITDCESGYHPSDDGTSCEQSELSEADSKQKVADLKDNAQKMKEKEQSTANKALGAAAIGATGIGAMNMMSGMAEQKADEAAEEDMKAYLATFVCDYGQGRNIKGGETNIDLPGGNELTAQVNEYKALAADLKVRKEALGKTPGIESEIIYDIAETGLYDNVGLGRQSGAYTSLSKALTDETSKDAEAWSKQKADAKSKVKTGAITAGVGALGGIAGNLAINSGEKNKNKVDEINKKYEGLKQPIKKLEKTINQNPQEAPTPCPADASGTPGDCTCNDKNAEYNANTNTCSCKNGYDGNPCTEIPLTVTPQCTFTPEQRENINIDMNTGACTCNNGALNVPECDCMAATHEWVNNTCVEKQQPKVNPIVQEDNLNINLAASSLFDLGKYTLKPTAYSAIGEFKGAFKIWRQQYPDAAYCIKITGHTDKTGTDKINNPLSENRAKAIQNALTEDNTIPAANTVASGVGSRDCQTPTQKPDANCRKVTIEFKQQEC